MFINVFIKTNNKPPFMYFFKLNIILESIVKIVKHLFFFFNYMIVKIITSSLLYKLSSCL